MLDINKADVDFLVTENMITEVNCSIERDVPKLKEISDEMLNRKIERVYFVACGSPLCAARTAKLLFDRYSPIHCEVYSGWEFIDNGPFVLGPNTAVVAITDYGKTEEVIQSVELARQKSAMTIVFTKKATNPIASVGEFLVAYEAECIWEIHLLLSYVLSIQFINKVMPNIELERIYEDLFKLPQVLEKLVTEYEATGKELGKKASKWPMIYTVAAGPLRPLAYKEGIITLMEFTWTHGSMVESGEFRHGPLEIVEEGVPFIFLLGTDESRHTTERAIRFVKKLTKDVIVIDYREFANGLHPALSPFVLFVPMEWICYYLSIYKDHNPDDRRYYGGLVEY